tara:strand:- start:446 stop:739 length:294 start_codon:yes stop_codon:yes gene_type:complete
MKKIKIIVLFLSLFFLYNCIDLNSKKTADEFLVKKKDPLILPPEFEELPLPNSKKEKNVKSSSSIRSVLDSSETSTEVSEDKSILENMILKELSKKN